MIMTQAIQVKRADVVAEVRELAAVLGVSLTDAIHEAVKERLLAKKAAARAEREAGHRRARKILEEIWKLPKIGEPLTDADLYDEEGMPK